jgi:hypothetical protein
VNRGSKQLTKHESIPYYRPSDSGGGAPIGFFVLARLENNVDNIGQFHSVPCRLLGVNRNQKGLRRQSAEGVGAYLARPKPTHIPTHGKVSSGSYGNGDLAWR